MISFFKYLNNIFFEFFDFIGQIGVYIFYNKTYQKMDEVRFHKLFALENRLLQKATILYEREPYASEMSDIIRSIKEVSPRPSESAWDSIIMLNKQNRN